MISVVVPTRNRAYILDRTLGSCHRQALVTEVIVIDDASSDGTRDVVSAHSRRHRNTATRYHANDRRLGAAASRNIGVSLSTNEFILFSDDDIFLENNYASVCLAKLKGAARPTAAVAGRLILLRPGEDPYRAIARFGSGTPGVEIFDPIAFAHRPDAYHSCDVEVPMTHSVILSRKQLVQQYPFDPFFSRGNGFREESTFQVQAFVDGYSILQTDDTHCMHVHEKETQTGGSRVSMSARLFWNSYYTYHFYARYYGGLRGRMKLPYPRSVAFLLYLSSLCIDFGFALMRSVSKRARAAIRSRRHAGRLAAGKRRDRAC